MARLRRVVRIALELAGAAFWMTRIEFGLRTGDLSATCRKIQVHYDLDSAAPPATEPVTLPRNTEPAVFACCLVVAHWPAGDTCLRRCLLVGHRLRRLGPVLRIGVRRDEHGAFSAHSWLEIDGRTLDAAAASFGTLGTVAR